MADKYTQLGLYGDNRSPEPARERTTLVMYQNSEGEMRFNCGGYSGCVDLGWYADGEDAPWSPATEGNVYDDGDGRDTSSEAELGDPEVPEYPQWLDLELLNNYNSRDLDHRLIVRPNGSDEPNEEEPEETIGEQDTSDSQRAFSVITVSFDPPKYHSHNFAQRWIYWQRIEPNQVGELDDRFVRDIVHHATSVVTHMQDVRRFDSFTAPSGVMGVCVVQDRISLPD